ncbi:hypothetical protein [Paenibacillus abyssi]|uniref:Uncharacterized protein n=1 Tax=Paenibacillus abyssi TaxID=1340531 RepID=A0A917CRQ1_9BACL|nr:hypothetical protein [Paenibacillus abyssi]GGF94269.1 hypothetical protein GCM10010916_09530 [Paenibacillus abyssi]
MSTFIREQFQSKDIHLPEQDYEILAERMAGLAQLRAAVEEEKLDDFNMQLLLIPSGGIAK